MTPTPEEAAEVYFRTKSVEKTAKHFGLTHWSMERLLGRMNISKSNSERTAKKANVPHYPIGTRVIWKPVTARKGFNGMPEAREHWPCIVKEGPAAGGEYKILYDGPNLQRRAARTVFVVNGVRLFPEET